jgi:hypothetical protein
MVVLPGATLPLRMLLLRAGALLTLGSLDLAENPSAMPDMLGGGRCEPWWMAWLWLAESRVPGLGDGFTGF